MRALNRPISRNAPACSQAPRSFFGQRRFSPNRLRVFCRMPPDCSHSPGSGMGQMLHQDFPPKGIKTSLRALHQAIQTKIMAKLWLPTGEPNSPAAMVKAKPARVSRRSRSCGSRRSKSGRSQGMRARLSRKGWLGRRGEAWSEVGASASMPGAADGASGGAIRMGSFVARTDWAVCAAWAAWAAWASSPVFQKASWNLFTAAPSRRQPEAQGPPASHPATGCYSCPPAVCRS